MTCIDTNRFVYEIETEYFYKGIGKDVETKFDTSTCPKNGNRPLPIVKKKKEKERKENKSYNRVCWHAYKKIDKKLEDKHCKGTKKSAVA